MITPTSEEFTIATLFDSATRIGTLAAAVDRLGTGRVSITREDIDEKLPTDESLGSVEAEALLVGLVLNDAAEKVGRETPFVDATFEVDIEKARTVLKEQIVARTALERERDSDQRPDDTELVATIPPQLDVEPPPSVGDLDTRVRSALLTAKNVVRIANPYFDPDHPTVETLRTLPRRGVETRILTREIRPGTDRYDVLSAMNNTLSEDERELVDVAELFALNDAGHQAYATHAKMVVTDDTHCYLGSANFTVTNLSSNFEIGILTSGHAVSVATDTFDAVFEASRSVSLPD